MINKFGQNSSTEKLNFNSKISCNANSDKLHGWLSLDSKYTVNEFIENILENEYE